MKKIILPVRVHPDIALAVISDAAGFYRTKDGIVEAALKNHFQLNKAKRKTIYKSVPKKNLWGTNQNKNHEPGN